MGGAGDSRKAQSVPRSCLLRRGLLAAVVLAGGSFAGLWWGRTHLAGGFENAHLGVAPEYLNFGEVWEQKAFCWTLPIHNRSSRDVAVHRLIASCRCIEVAPRSLVIPARGTAEVRVTLDLTTRRSGATEWQPRPFSARIVPVVEEGLPQYRGWDLEGLVRRPFRLSPSVLSFGDSLVAGEAFEARTAEVTAEVPLARLTAEAEGQAPAAVAVEQADAPGRYRVRVTPRQGTPVGQYPFNVLLRATTPSGERIPLVPLPVMMEVVQDVEAVPGTVTFGSLCLGESAEEAVVLQSRTGKAFEVASTAFDPESGLTLKRVAPIDGEPCFLLRQRAVALRWQEQEVRFTLQDASGQPTQEITVPVDYYGVAGTESGGR